MARDRRNEPERLFEELARSRGWVPTKLGWPDFMCRNPEDGKIIAVEVKPRIGDGRLKSLKESQADCMDWLTSKGIRCFVSDGEVLEPYEREKHRHGWKRRLAKSLLKV